MPDAIPGKLVAPEPVPPVRQYSFTDWQVNNPSAPPPGDRLDAEFDRGNGTQSQTLDWVGTSLNTDGTLRTGIVGEPQLVPGLFDHIADDAVAQVQPLVVEAENAAGQALNSANAALSYSTLAGGSATQAGQAATTARGAATGAQTSASAALDSANAASASASGAANSASHADGDAALCTDYGLVTQAWAEHMPDTIPPNILAVMGVTGDHWSSRWWANRAAETLGEMEDLLGTIPPLAVVFYYTFIARAGQTVFTGADRDGKVLTYTPGPQQTMLAYVNGLLRTPVDDYTTSLNTLTFNIPRVAGDIVQIQVEGVATGESVYLPLAGGTMTGAITLAADPAGPLQPVTRQYADAHFLPFTGGTLTGPLVLAADPGAPLGAVTKQYVDAHAPLGGPYLPLAGGTVTDNLGVNGTLQVAGGTTMGALGVNGRLQVPNGPVSFGAGTFSADAAGAFQVLYDADPSTIPANRRQSHFTTHLTCAATSSTIWENMSSFVYVDGPGVANGEINGFHAFIQVNAGASAQVVEGFEASVLNNGTMNSYAGYLGLFNNGAAGTASAITGATYYLNNLNTAAGSVVQWNGINFPGRTGGGSKPTFYNAIRVADEDLGIVTMGGILIGGLGNATPGQLQILGADTSGGTFSFNFHTSAGNIVLFANNGAVSFPKAGVSINPPGVGAGSPLSIAGFDNAAGSFPVSVRNLAGTNLLSVSNSGAATFGSAAVNVSINPAGTGGAGVLVKGADNAAGTFPLSVKNLANANLLSVSNAGAVTLGAGLGVFGSPGPGAKPNVTGSTGGNVALQSLLAALASYGMVNDLTNG